MWCGAGGCGKPHTYRALVGTYTEGTDSKGIYSYEIDAETGIARLLAVGTEGANPSYLALTPDHQYLYAANEAGAQSAVTAFALDKTAGNLAFINTRRSPDIDPCHIAALPQHIITAGYTSGSIAVYERAPNGAAGGAVQTVYHTGKSGADPERQMSPHVHQTALMHHQKILLACDLGADMVASYRYNPNADNILVRLDSIVLTRGGGPRHIAVDNIANRAYLVQELDASIVVLGVDSGGHFRALQHIAMADSTAEGAASAVRLSPDRRFLYAANRGNANTITCFAVNADNGALTRIETIATGGAGPRDFAITPDGAYVLVTHQYSHSIAILKRCQTTGKLTATGRAWDVPAPVCIVAY